MKKPNFYRDIRVLGALIANNFSIKGASLDTGIATTNISKTLHRMDQTYVDGFFIKRTRRVFGGSLYTGVSDPEVIEIIVQLYGEVTKIEEGFYGKQRKKERVA